MGVLAGLLSGGKSSADLTDRRFWEDVGFLRKTASGETVTPTKALTLAAYYAALRVLAEDVAKLPVHVYRPLKPRGQEVLSDDPVSDLLRTSPNPEMSAFTFRETLTQWAAGWGNGYAEIVRNGAGVPAALWPIHPSRVKPMRRENGVLFYRVFAEYDPTNPAKEKQSETYVDLEAHEVLHIRGMGNAVVGYSVAAFAAETIGVSLATQTFGAAFFANGTQGGGILTHPEKLSDTARQNLRDTWSNVYGGAAKGYRVKILEEGMTFTNTFVPPNEAQFLETREFQIEEVARWFRTAPHKIGHLKRASFSNIEQQAIEHVTDTLLPWLIRWEQEVRRKLLTADRFLKHNVNGLLRGDANARANYFRTMANIGALSPNDIRELEDLNPIPGDAGDEYFMVSNMATIDRIADGTAAPGAKTPGRPRTVDDATEDEEATVAAEAESMERHRQVRSQAEAMRAVLAAAADRVLRKEAKAIENAKGKATFAQWAPGFYAEQATYAVEALEPGVQALAKMTADVLGIEERGIPLATWANDRMARARDGVVKAGGAEGIPTDHAPAALADELLSMVLRTYEVEP